MPTSHTDTLQAILTTNKPVIGIWNPRRRTAIAEIPTSMERLK